MNYELKKLFSKVLNSFFCYVRFVYALEFITKHPPAPSKGELIHECHNGTIYLKT